MRRRTAAPPRFLRGQRRSGRSSRWRLRRVGSGPRNLRPVSRMRNGMLSLRFHDCQNLTGLHDWWLKVLVYRATHPRPSAGGCPARSHRRSGRRLHSLGLVVVALAVPVVVVSESVVPVGAGPACDRRRRRRKLVSNDGSTSSTSRTPHAGRQAGRHQEGGVTLPCHSRRGRGRGRGSRRPRRGWCRFSRSHSRLCATLEIVVRAVEWCRHCVLIEEAAERDCLSRVGGHFD